MDTKQAMFFVLAIAVGIIVYEQVIYGIVADAIDQSKAGVI